MQLLLSSDGMIDLKPVIVFLYVMVFVDSIVKKRYDIALQGTKCLLKFPSSLV